MNKMIISATAMHIDATFDLRFGRAHCFCCFDTKNLEVTFIENPHKDLKTEAGIKTVKMLSEIGVKAVVSGDFGSKVTALLQKKNVQMIILNTKDVTIKSIIDQLTLKYKKE